MTEYEELKAIVDKFNDDFKAWTEKSSCVAEFGWNYTGCKSIAIKGIDKIIWRQPAPTADYMAEAIKGVKKLV